MGRIVTWTIGGGIIGYLGYKFMVRKREEIPNSLKKEPALSWSPLERKEIIKKYRNTLFDILIIGGGSAGTGCALDAATRGLKVALVEKADFGGETSSKSTKLLHGGIRYLEKAIKSFDITQFRLVREGLKERHTVMKIAPHLTKKLAIMIPVYHKLMIPYFLAGMKLYDLISGSRSLGGSYFLNKENTLAEFPALKRDRISGSVVYYDGQFDDSRLNVSLAMTASYHGAVVGNYVNVVSLIHDLGVIKGAKCVDQLTKEEFVIRAKGVINSTGPFLDSIRSMYKTNVRKVVAPSIGTHIILPPVFAPRRMGLVLPETSDGRVLFFIPWKKHAMIGTTDVNCEVVSNPAPSKNEVNFILNEVKNNVEIPESISKDKILAAWSGIRPLVRDPSKGNTESLVRNHLIHVSENKLISLSGGKWTTYRKMAEDTIDKAIDVFSLNPVRKCATENVLLIGSHKFAPDLFLKISHELQISPEIAKNLVFQYGDRARKFASILTKENSVKISQKFENLLAEVDYCIQNEMVHKITDFMTRRIRMGFLNFREAEKSLDIVGKHMAKNLQWSRLELKNQVYEAKRYLKTLYIPD